MANDDPFVAAQKQGRFGPRCTVALVRENESAKDKKFFQSFESALANPTIDHRTIARVLRERGYKIGETSIGRHRRHDCLCK